MKSKMFGILAALVAVVPCDAAVSIVIRNFTSATVGVPIVSALGTPIDQGGAFAAGGVFGAVNFSEMTASQVLGLFTPLDGVSVALNANFDGLFSGTDLNGSYASGAFANAPAYVVVGNNSNILLSTAIAVYQVGSNFPVPDGLGNASANFAAVNINNWVYGAKVPVSSQPSLANAAFVDGIQMVAVPIPEPSAALLGAIGALGLLRRRRN